MVQRTYSRGDIAKEVTASLEAITRPQLVRDYVGASIIGNNCDRALFYTKEMVAGETPEARVLRIFAFGDSIETLAVRWLREAGFFVYDTDPRTGGQFRVSTPGREVQGHTDGIISNYRLTPDIFEEHTILAHELHDQPLWAMGLEIKSHKELRYQEVVDIGVQESKFDHYAQMQTYMQESRQMTAAFGLDLQLEEFLYVAINKDTSAVYLEQVKYDADTALRLTSRARRIHRAPAPPPRVAEDIKKSPCKWCSFKIHCYTDNRAVSIPERARHASGSVSRIPVFVSEVSNIRGAKRQLPDDAYRNEVTAGGSAAWRD